MMTDYEITHTPSGMRHGVAKIVANVGAGVYTITEQWRTAGGANQNAVSPPGRVGITAREINALATGSANDIVRFWEAPKIDGTIETLMDIGGVPGIGDDKYVSVVAGDSPDYLGEQVKTYATDSSFVGVVLESDGAGEAAKLQGKIPLGDLAGGYNTDYVGMNTLKVEAGALMDPADTFERTIVDANLKGAVIFYFVHGRAVNEAAVNVWDTYFGNSTTVALRCHVIDPSLSADLVLGVVNTSAIECVIDAADGKLKWKGTQYNDADLTRWGAILYWIQLPNVIADYDFEDFNVSAPD